MEVFFLDVKADAEVKLLSRRIILCCLALMVLSGMCVQMAVCLASDDCSSEGPACCHDCACCSLLLGFPPAVQIHSFASIEVIRVIPAPRTIEKSNPRIERPPRS
jgi:hypothetical protein